MEVTMSALITQDQGTIVLAQQDYIPIVAESFLIDRRAQGLAPTSIVFYRKKLKYLLAYCEAQAVTQISQLTPDIIRCYLLELADRHNEGGVHASFRVLRTFMYWVEEEEIMPIGWKNPMRRVKTPKLSIQPIEPVPLHDVSALIATCDHAFHGARDKAIMLTLLDTGARAKELLDLNLEDVDLADGSVLVRHGKGRKPRMVYLGRKTRRAIRVYKRFRRDTNPALWTSSQGERVTYNALRCILRRRAHLAGLKSIPLPHDFRRAFALTMLRSGVDIFSLQKLMGHADLQVLRRYLAQTDQDIHIAHMRGSPVDNHL
jgi:integrase/recombinase XerC